MTPQEEAIELLEKEEYLVKGEWTKTPGVVKAIAKLREIPKPNEFTKMIRFNLENWKSVLWEEVRVRTVVKWLKDVCFRYDYVVKRNAELQAQIDKLVAGTPINS